MKEIKLISVDTKWPMTKYTKWIWIKVVDTDIWRLYYDLKCEHGYNHGVRETPWLLLIGLHSLTTFSVYYFVGESFTSELHLFVVEHSSVMLIKIGKPLFLFCTWPEIIEFN